MKNRMPHVQHNLQLSGVLFVLTVIICVCIKPNDIFTHDGLSFYGNYAKTLIPYGVGLAATAYFIVRAGHDIGQDKQLLPLRYGLEVLAIGLLGIIATPSFSPSTTIDDMHVTFGFIIFLTQALFSLRYIIKSPGDWLLVSLQFAATACVALSFSSLNIFDFMLPAQFAAIITFSALHLRAVRHARLRAVAP